MRLCETVNFCTSRVGWRYDWQIAHGNNPLLAQEARAFSCVSNRVPVVGRTYVIVMLIRMIATKDSDLDLVRDIIHRYIPCFLSTHGNDPGPRRSMDDPRPTFDRLSQPFDAFRDEIIGKCPERFGESRARDNYGPLDVRQTNEREVDRIRRKSLYVTYT